MEGSDIINKQVNNLELREAIKDFQKDPNSISKEVELIKLLKKARFLIPVKQDNGRSFALIQDSKNNIYYPIFTDYEEYEKYKQSLNTLLVTIEDVFYLCLDNPDPNVMGITINPFGENFMIYKEGINRIRSFHYLSRSELEKVQESNKDTLRKLVETNEELISQVMFLLDCDHWYIPTKEATSIIDGKEYLLVLTSKKEALSFQDKINKDSYIIKLNPKKAIQELLISHFYLARGVVFDNLVKFENEEFIKMYNELLPVYCEEKFEEIKSIESEGLYKEAYIKNVLYHPILYEVVIQEEKKKVPILINHNNKKYGFLFTSEKLANSWVEKNLKKDKYGFSVEKINTIKPIYIKYKNFDYIIVNSEFRASYEEVRHVEKELG